MQTIKGAMLWLVVVMAMVLGACSSEPLPGEMAAAGGAGAAAAGGTAGASDAGGAGGATGGTDAAAEIPGLVGRWCSDTLGELDFNQDGTYAHTPPNSATDTGTWKVEAPNAITFIWADGIASAIVQVTPSTLTMYGGSGKLVYTRCP